jgi:hypothetical protein
MVAASNRTAFAIREVGLGNSPIPDPGWPKGAAAVFNNPTRIAWWKHGDGGLYGAEFRGDARSLSTVLTDFAKLDAKTKRLVVHDGVGQGILALQAKQEDPAKEAEVGMDWAFTVWVPAEWERPSHGIISLDLIGAETRDADKCPPPQIDVYTGGNIRWSDVTVPEGIEVSDERLEAHGFTLADGIVLEGKVVDLATHQPLAAKMYLERIEDHVRERTDKQSNDGNRYTYTAVAEAAIDAQGRWILKHAPEGWYRVVVAAEGYVPRWVENYNSKSDIFRAQPGWHAYNCGLSRPAFVLGRVADEAGKPLADVEVRLDDVVSGGDVRYASTHEYVSKTDVDGRFRLDEVPTGSATIRVRKSGYCLPGAKHPITTPAEDVALKMVKSAQVRVTVDFTGTSRPETYIMEIHPLVGKEPEGGAAVPTQGERRIIVTLTQPEGEAAVGPWIEIRIIDANNQACFNGVPPGKYVLQGWPSRYGSGGRDTPFTGVQRSKPLAIELNSGQTAEITLPAK